jgi:hypothetical protein
MAPENHNNSETGELGSKSRLTTHTVPKSVKLPTSAQEAILLILFSAIGFTVSISFSKALTGSLRRFDSLKDDDDPTADWAVFFITIFLAIALMGCIFHVSPYVTRKVFSYDASYK